jgi:hypothetical protein
MLIYIIVKEVLAALNCLFSPLRKYFAASKRELFIAIV